MQTSGPSYRAADLFITSGAAFLSVGDGAKVRCLFGRRTNVTSFRSITDSLDLKNSAFEFFVLPVLGIAPVMKGFHTFYSALTGKCAVDSKLAIWQSHAMNRKPHNVARSVPVRLRMRSQSRSIWLDQHPFQQMRESIPTSPTR